MKSTTSDISVIIPTVGRDQWLEEALKSVCRQTLQPAETIVVDGVLSEDRREWVERTGARYLVCESTSAGASASRNFGFANSRGCWVAFLDDDDLWEPDFLELTVDLVRRSGVDFVVVWSDFFSLGGERRGHRMPLGVRPEQAMEGNPGFTGSNALLSREALSSVQGFDEQLRVSNDRDLLIRLLVSDFSYGVVDEVLTRQRIHGAGQLTSRTLARAQGLELFAKKHEHLLTRRSRRLLKREILSVRRVADPRVVVRGSSAARQVLTYTPRELAERIQQRRSAELKYR